MKKKQEQTAYKHEVFYGKTGLAAVQKLSEWKFANQRDLDYGSIRITATFAFHNPSAGFKGYEIVLEYTKD